MTSRHIRKQDVNQDFNNNHQQLRQELSKKLPNMLSVAIASYEHITISSKGDDVKSFNAIHTAAKSALSHIESLLKLAKWAGLEDARQQETIDNHDDQIATIIKAAKSAMNGNNNNNEVN